MQAFGTAIAERISTISSIYRLNPFLRDIAYDAIWSDLSIPDLLLLLARLAMGFSVALRRLCCLALKVMSAGYACML